MLNENDVCLMYVNGLPTNFIRIESIVPDVKPGWYEVSFVELVLPLQTIKWKIDTGHLAGETIHMKGTKFNFQYIPCQVEKKEIKEIKPSDRKPAKVISLADFKERRKVKEAPLELPPDVA